VIRLQHKALSTEQTYVFWLRRYIRALYAMPKELTSEKKVERFLTDLARKQDVSGSSQNQAFNAILPYIHHPPPVPNQSYLLPSHPAQRTNSFPTDTFCPPTDTFCLPIKGEKCNRTKNMSTPRNQLFTRFSSILTLTLYGCIAPKSLTGGKALTTITKAGTLTQGLTQGQNAAQPSKQDQHSIRTRNYALPQASQPLVLGVVTLAVGAWFLAHRHGQLRGALETHQNLKTTELAPRHQTPPAP
jgi:hypothetical protein